MIVNQTLGELGILTNHLRFSHSLTWHPYFISILLKIDLKRFDQPSDPYFIFISLKIDLKRCE